MFKKFIERFKVDNNTSSEEESITNFVDQHLSELIGCYGNKSFNKGILKIHSLEDVHYWNIEMIKIFPQYKNKINCFAHDWLGRIFAVNEFNKSVILMFEAGTGEVFEIPVDIITFFNHEIINNSDAALAESFFNDFLHSRGLKEIKISDCAGYVVPLFLNGEDDVNNIKITNLKFYWDITAQLITKTK